MRIVFYAPLKPLDHPVPSGDRRLGRLIVDALRRAGHEVEIACRLRTHQAGPDAGRQARLQALAERMAGGLIRRYRNRAAERRPEAWFTYHLYYKAPDWLGPRVAAAMGIPYLAAEASLAPKRAAGPWHLGHQAVLAALTRADAVFAMSALDAECLAPALGPDGRLERMAPFLDPAPYREAALAKAAHRVRIAAAHGIDAEVPWLIAVGMMREGDKLRSYEILGRALQRILDRPWRLLIVGDGPARPAVERTLSPVGSRATLIGALEERRLADYYAAADLMVWPAINEAFGMALLEAQAAGTPVVAGAAGGVGEVVRHGTTGALTPPGDEEGFAAAVAALLDDPARRRRLARATRPTIDRFHGLDAAARSLDAALIRAQQRKSA